MKRFFYAMLLVSASAFAFTACNNGLYDADVDNTNNGGNPLNPGGGGGGTGGGGGSAADFPWSGTDPVSAKIEGNLEVFDVATVFDFSGFFGMTATNSAGNSITIQVPSGTPSGVYQMNGSNSASYSQGSSTVFGSGIPGGTPGKIYVETNDATTFKGKFYFTGADPIGGGKRVVSEGYFNVAK